MTIIFNIFIGLFTLKILWNLIIPYNMAYNALNANGRKIGGVSLMPYLECGLLLLAIGAAALCNGETWFKGPKQVAIFGVLAIIISYIHMILVCIVGGWMIKILKRNGTDHSA